MPPFDVVAIVLIARHGGETEEVRTVARRLAGDTLYCVLLAPLMIGLYDLCRRCPPSAAARWWFSGRNIAGGIAAGLGTLMKIFPGLVAAPALVWEASQVRTTRARGVAAFLGTLAAGVAAGRFWLGGSRAVELLGYHNQRGWRSNRSTAGCCSSWGRSRGGGSLGYNYSGVHAVPERGSETGAVCLSAPGRGAPGGHVAVPAIGDGRWSVLGGRRRAFIASARCYPLNT